MYISRPTECTNYYNASLFIIKCSTCFGLFSPSPGATFWSGISHLIHVYVSVTTAWRVHRLRMEERPPIWRVTANKLNKQSRTADKGWSSSLRVGKGANNSSPWKIQVFRTTHRRYASSGDKTMRW